MSPSRIRPTRCLRTPRRAARTGRWRMASPIRATHSRRAKAGCPAARGSPAPRRARRRRSRGVLHRRRPGVVVQLVVLRAERLENELGSLETERDVEVARDELGHATDRNPSHAPAFANAPDAYASEGG